jgi:hypothetical protein
MAIGLISTKKVAAHPRFNPDVTTRRSRAKSLSKANRNKKGPFHAEQPFFIKSLSDD